MTLQSEVKRALDALTPFAAGEQAIEANFEGQALRCDLVALDRLACAFNRLTLRTDDLARHSSEQLRKVAERLSSRLTYLLEPISPIEIDSEGCTVQLRSNPPQRDEDQISYYELLVSRKGELSLSRFARSRGAPRSVIPAQLTREVLLRLVNDFSNVVREKA